MEAQSDRGRWRKYCKNCFNGFILAAQEEMEKVDSYHDGSDFLIAKQRAAEKFDVVGVNWLKDEKTVLENQKDWGERKQIWKEGTYGKVVDCWK